MNHVAAVQVFLLAIFCLVLSGCGGSSSAMPGPTPTPITFESGLYEIDEASAVNPGTKFTLQGSLLQSGNNLSGVMHASGLSCFSFNTDIPVSGTLGIDNTGNFSVNLVLSLPGGQTLSLNTIHPFGHLGIISGTYSLARRQDVQRPTRGMLSASRWVLAGHGWDILIPAEASFPK